MYCIPLTIVRPVPGPIASWAGSIWLWPAAQHKPAASKAEEQARKVHLRTFNFVRTVTLLRGPASDQQASTVHFCTVMAANKTKTSSLSAQDRSGSELMQGGPLENNIKLSHT